MLIVLIFSLYFIILVLLRLKFKKSFENYISLNIIAFILILIATNRSPEMPDYKNYYTAFIEGGSDHNEPAFDYLLSVVRQYTDDVRTFFLIVALISVTLNIFAIAKYSNFTYLSLLLYISNEFILHDMIQIRCGIAAALILYSFPSLYNRNTLKYFSIILVCTLFHYTSLSFLPLYFINSRKINIKFYSCLIPLGYLMYFIGVMIGKFASLIPIPAIQILFNMYQTSMGLGIGSEINVFNMMILMKIAIAYVLLYNVRKIFNHNKYVIIWLKIYIIGIFIFLVCGDIPVMSFRFSELLHSLDFLLIPLMVYAFPKKNLLLAKFTVVLIGVIFFYSNAIYNEFLIL